MKEHVTAMYINSYGVSFHEHLNTKQKAAKSMVMHLQELPVAEVPRNIEMEDSPLASASATFNELFPKGFAIHQPKKKTKFTEDQLLYIRERFAQSRSKTTKKPNRLMWSQKCVKRLLRVKMVSSVRKFVIEEWLAVSSSWQLTSHALYYKIP